MRPGTTLSRSGRLPPAAPPRLLDRALLDGAIGRLPKRLVIGTDSAPRMSIILIRRSILPDRDRLRINARGRLFDLPGRAIRCPTPGCDDSGDCIGPARRVLERLLDRMRGGGVRSKFVWEFPRHTGRPTRRAAPPMGASPLRLTPMRSDILDVEFDRLGGRPKKSASIL